MESHRIRKALIPAAGNGTRMGAMTRAIPKELLPLVDRPALDWIIDECIEAGASEIAIITSEYKKPIFQRHLNDYYPNISFTYLIQAQANGLGGAILCGEQWAGSESFLVLLPDDLVLNENISLKLRESYELLGISAISLSQTSQELLENYGVAAVANSPSGQIMITDLVEKPKPGTAPSNFSVNGRYLLTSDIWAALKSPNNFQLGEIQLTPALAEIARGEGLSGVETTGIRCDLGNPQSWLRSNNLFAQSLSR